ncbi:MAG: 5-formyltetrahydrofolate cyclo-ligase [Clostridiales bacterium]|nr:5-formyltetrahydrofolate cyclo-ligase [Clostridiales bacterium]
MQSEYTSNDKIKLREILKLRRQHIDCRERREIAATDNILPRLYGNVLVYVSMGSELSTKMLIDELMGREGVAVYVPLTKDGIITPVRLIKRASVADKLGNIDDSCYDKTDTATKIDCCVTPILGYNGNGHRIGYGKGCYDRLFSDGRVGICNKIGLAFDCQKCEFDADKHDIALDICVTESGIEVFS